MSPRWIRERYADAALQVFILIAMSYHHSYVRNMEPEH
jgi:hypothetical protein